MNNFLLLAACVSIYSSASAQSLKVLFLGNSYTASNNLPQLTANFANGAGKTMVYNSNTPGGYALNHHTTNAATQVLIEQGGWDYVVLQEQSQIPSFPQDQFENTCLPYAQTLVNQIEESNPCSEVMFYMTWGRENGDSQNCSNWPPVCSYEGMDDLLYERYMLLAETFDGSVSPVGRVWRYLREHHPSISLYVSDGSHPSVEGSYAAACAFYTLIYKSDPTESTYNSSLSQETAEIIRQAAKSVVYNELYRWIPGEIDPQVSITSNEVDGLTYQFNANYESNNLLVYKWYFGFDQLTGQAVEVTFPEAGTYQVMVNVENGCEAFSNTMEITVGTVDVPENEGSETLIYPNPSRGGISIQRGMNELNKEVAVRDMTGRLILTTRNNYITLPSGVYWIEGRKVVVY